MKAGETLKPFKLTEKQLFSALTQLSSNMHIIVTSHAEKRMNERNICYDDILRVLNNPIKLIGDITYNKEHDNYTYKVQGNNIYHDIVVSIDFVTGSILVITVIDNRL